MASQRITKRVVDGLKTRESEYAVWDAQMPGFGIRVRPTGAKSYIVVYRAGSGRGAPVRRGRRQNRARERQEACQGHSRAGGARS
jgi:hypothetical protein